MGTTNLSSSSSPHLPWVWVIEALTEFEQLDTALLDDLLINVPELSDQSWGRNARERLALRHMEDLLRGLSPNADATNVASTSKSHSMFDISDLVRAEDVLFCVRNQIAAAAHMRKSELELLRSGAYQFILQKRASLPKCALQQLKDKIVEGDQLSTIFLSESSGLDREHQEDERVPMEGGPNGAEKIVDHSICNVAVPTSDVYSKSLSPENSNDVSQECPGKVHFGGASDAPKSPGERTEDGKAPSISEVSASGDHVDEVVQDPLNAVLISGKRKISVCKEQQESFLNINNICVDRSEIHVDAEKFDENGKLNSMEDDTNSQNVNGTTDCPRQRNLLSSTSEVRESAKGATVQDLQENEISVVDGDDSCLLIAKRIRHGTNDGDIQACNLRISDNEGEKLEVRSDVPHPNDYVEKADDYCTKPEASSSKEGNLDKPYTSVSDEDAAIVGEKASFLCSQNMLNQDSERMDQTEQSFCIKCDRGGQLLICCVSSCPIVVHESCIGSSGCFDETGNFYCPFCSFSQATAACRETKKKAALAKEKAALARNHLLKFMSMIHANRLEQSSEKTNMEKHSPSKVVKDNESHDIMQQNAETVHGPSPSIADSGEHFSSENDDCTSFEFRRRQRTVDRSSNQASPHSRRQKIPWTAEEEQKLKEGVRTFASTDGKNIPWKKILLFGQHIFQESRTTVDLKDKWRNICREGRRALA